MLIEIDRNSRKLLKDLVVVFEDGAEQRIPDEVLIFDVDDCHPTTLRAEIVVPIRFGSMRKPVQHFLASGQKTAQISIDTSPDRLVVSG